MFHSGFAVLAGLSLNLILVLTVGLGAAARANKVPFFQIAVLFVSVLLLWILHNVVFTFLLWDIAVFFLSFPLSALLCLAFEAAQTRLFPKQESPRVFSAATAYEGLVPASFILTSCTAATFTDALVLSLFFALGCLAAIAFAKEIRRRSSLEKIGHVFRGIPLVLISLGLLSMVLSLAVGIFFKILQN